MRPPGQFPIPHYALDGLTEERLRALIESEEESKQDQSRRWLHCRRCGYRITREEDRMEFLGGHQHTRTNPHGITFHFGSFGAAEGCRVTGEPVAAFTWFAGFYWRIALCGGCGVHLGWKFEAPDLIFFGLVLERLKTVDEHPGNS